MKKMPTKSVFAENNYVNSYLYYCEATGNIPSRTVFKEIELPQFLTKLEKSEYNYEQIYSTTGYSRKKEEFLPGIALFKFSKNLYLSIIDPPYSDLAVEILHPIKLTPKEQATVDDLQKMILSCLRSKEDFKNQLHVMSGSGHFYFEKFDIKTPEIDIAKNYNDDFASIDKIIRKELNEEANKGIVILHGKPGTGKTYYIRHLIASLKKQKLYIPPNLAEQIASPSFISVLEDNGNSILIIEDAENILEKRSANSGSAVSNLLNLSDGLLADCFNIQIICTFNSSLGNIDDALLRKGRLIAQYEFKPLATEKAQALSDELGNKANISKPTPLSEIFNLNKETGIREEKKKVGFVR